MLYRDGLPVATFAAGEMEFLATLDAAEQWEARKALPRCAGTASVAPAAHLRGERAVQQRQAGTLDVKLLGGAQD